MPSLASTSSFSSPGGLLAPPSWGAHGLYRLRARRLNHHSVAGHCALHELGDRVEQGVVEQYDHQHEAIGLPPHHSLGLHRHGVPVSRRVLAEYLPRVQISPPKPVDACVDPALRLAPGLPRVARMRAGGRWFKGSAVATTSRALFPLYNFSRFNKNMRVIRFYFI